MTSEAPYLHCRLCGLRYRSDKVIDHEMQCSYQNSNARGSSNNTGEESPQVSSKDDYYMQNTRSNKPSEEKPKDLTSNEESDDSPFNKMNRTTEIHERREYHEKPAKRDNRTGTRTAQLERSRDSVRSSNGSSERDWKTETTYDTIAESGKRTETKNYYEPDGRLIKTESKTTYYDPEKRESRSEIKTTSYAREGKTPDAGSNNSGSREKSPPGHSANRREMSAHHQRSHSNEKNRTKINPEFFEQEKVTPQKSDEQNKEAMIRTPYPSEEDIKMPPSSAAEDVAKAADVLANLPELNKHAENSFEKHQRSLVPCTHCERTFRPDRLPIHERACAERPKAREYITPEDNKK